MSPAFDAVLFDWCGTLVEYPTRQDRLRPVLEVLGRRADLEAVQELVDTIHAAELHPDAVAANAVCDLSAGHHAQSKRITFEIAGLDDELAVAIEKSYGDLDTYLLYPEVPEVLSALTTAGVKVAVVSDVHVDIRPHFEQHDLHGHISGYALSCEVGAMKPGPQMFETALAAVDCAPERCLMVGDNPHPDCGATRLGMTALILPVIRVDRPRLLDRVTRLASG